MTQKKFSTKKTDKELMKKFKIKKAKKIPVDSVTIYCTACTSKFTVNKKSDKGILVRQQFSPHTILEEVVI